ncbi:hypothetical protein [Flavobacterium sp. LC2016-01]|uniref:hypothetical protein n=1 Tax=Flavobacterium sp. LC2016-01 TaxID=2675876 RepID=UPI0012BB02E1|nr:hypothetical protein [Flavobacterium sp. LC2016-01]MTH13995.1 hypothetical protein [Flavobacterium sp. LC2016-01]
MIFSSKKHKKLLAFVFLLANTFSYSQKNNLNCSDLKFKNYYYKEKNTFKNGSIKLFSDKNGKRLDVLNKLILKNSEYLLELNLKNNSISFHKPDSIFDNSEENKTFQNWVDHLDLSKIFTLDAESKSYQKLSEERQLNNESGSLSTEIVCLNKILVYNIELNDGRDKGSPYNEFLNIDLTKMELIDFKLLVPINQLSGFNKAVLNYANGHKKEIVNNYKEIIANGFGDLLASYQDAFEQPTYNFNKINCKIDSSNFSHFNSEGITFTVNITDKNLNMNEERDQIGEYVSEIIIPFKEIKKYLDNKNVLFSSLIK